jgi:hypothetical protein
MSWWAKKLLSHQGKKLYLPEYILKGNKKKTIVQLDHNTEYQMSLISESRLSIERRVCEFCG